jgi:hypothetical protein
MDELGKREGIKISSNMRVLLMVFSRDSSLPFSPYTSGAGRGEGRPDLLTPPSKNEQTIHSLNNTDNTRIYERTYNLLNFGKF